MAEIKFADRTEFFDVEGIPVTISAGPQATPGMAAAAWDVAPPRHFPGDSARQNGAPITREAFLQLLSNTPHRGLTAL
jgi:hypothetical protein